MPNDLFKDVEFDEVSKRVSWVHQEGDKYLVTGRYPNSRKRIRLEYENYRWAFGINLHTGNRWLVRGGKRRLLSTVTN